MNPPTAHERLAGGALREMVLRAAEEVVTATRSLPAHQALAVAWDLYDDPDPTLRAAGKAVFRNMPAILASELVFVALTGKALALADRLGDPAPWGTIRQALRDVWDAWCQAEPESADRAMRRSARHQREANSRSAVLDVEPDDGDDDA